MHTLNTVIAIPVPPGQLPVLAVLPEASVAVHVTVVTPRGKHEPDGGVQATVTPGQLSDAEGDANVTVAQGEPIPGVTATTVSGAQDI
jgi:hypothetical protein